MKEKPMIIPVALSDSNLKSHSKSATNKDIPTCRFKIKALFYIKVDNLLQKQIDDFIEKIINTL